MSLGVINAVVAIATLAVLSATVFAAVSQLGHMRASNELEAVLAIEHEFRSRELQDALNYVQNHLPERLQDATYRSELSSPGYIDMRRHPEMRLCNWFNAAGSLVQSGFLNEHMFLNAFGRLVGYYWEALGPVIALLRRVRGSGQYAGFEYLAYRAQQRAQGKGRATYPRNARRLPIVDQWRSGDGTAHTE